MAEAQDAGSKKGWGWLRQVRLIPVSESALRVGVYVVYGIWNMERSFLLCFCFSILCLSCSVFTLHFRQVFGSPRCWRASLLVGSRRASVERGYCSLRVGPSPRAPCQWSSGSVVATRFSFCISFCLAYFLFVRGMGQNCARLKYTAGDRNVRIV